MTVESALEQLHAEAKALDESIAALENLALATKGIRKRGRPRTRPAKASEHDSGADRKSSQVGVPRRKLG